MLREILTAKVGPVLHFKNGDISLMCPVYPILIVIAAVVYHQVREKKEQAKASCQAIKYNLGHDVRKVALTSAGVLGSLAGYGKYSFGRKAGPWCGPSSCPQSYSDHLCPHFRKENPRPGEGRQDG